MKIQKNVHTVSESTSKGNWKSIVWAELYGPSLKVQCFVIFHNNSIFPYYSWLSLGYFAVNLTGGQPKMYWWLCCTGVKKSHEITHICCQTQGQHIQWKAIYLRWLCIDLELTPSEIMTSRETQECDIFL